MNFIVCVDQNNGMMFNGRRQSRDRNVINDILQYIGNAKLWLNEYSSKLFAPTDGNICIDDQFLQKAKESDFCFIENQSLKDVDVSKVILYRWDKGYPADLFLDMDLNSYILSETLEFQGYSHDKITREVYIKHE